MGGEEFAVFLPGFSPRRAAAIAERIRRIVTEVEFRPTGDRCNLSISVGAVTFGQETSLANLQVADLKLYDAKRNGRNRVEIGHVRAGARLLNVQ
jgi:diguanylate cyclase